MRTSRLLLIWLAAWTAWLPALLAQQTQSREPHIGYVFPAGGQRGQTFNVTVGGQFIGNTKDAIVSGSGVKVTVVDVYKPLNGKRFAELQDIIGAARRNAAAPPPAPVTTATSAVVAAKPAPAAKIVTTGTTPASKLGTPANIAACASPAPRALKAASPAKVIGSGSTALPTLKLNPPAKIVTTGTTPAAKPASASKLVASVVPSLPPWRNRRLATDVEILRQAGVPDDEIKKFVERRTRESDPKRQPNQQLAETVTVKVEIAPNAPTGPCDFRLATSSGVTNPLTFCVSSFPEQIADPSMGKTIDTATQVTLPVVLNGQILPGASHHFSFHARRGAHLVIATQARDLIPYLADTVPGWFQPAVALYNANGDQVAYGDHFRFSPDPVLFYDVPADGAYLLEVRDALFRGREDFVYRVTVGQIPYVTDIFPLGGSLGQATPVQVSGRNLSSTCVTLPSPKADGIAAIPSLENGFSTVGPLFAFDSLPQCSQSASGAGSSQVQRVALPIVINGRIAHPGDIETFAFSCKARETIVAEVYARRLNSPLDSLLKVVDSKGHQLAFNDDFEDKSTGLLTHCADSRLTFTAPADGLYYVLLADAQGEGGPAYSYRLRISDPIPDFVLRVLPSGISARPGVTVPITVYASRKDGFAGDISLSLKGSGLVLSGGRIPAGQDKVRATVTFPAVLQAAPIPLAVEGHAVINGHDIVRQAVPADDMVQAFMYHHMVPAREFVALLSGTGRGRFPINLLSAQPMVLKAGGTGQMIFAVQGRPPFAVAQTHVELSDAPDGISIQALTSGTNGAAISFKIDPTKIKPGSKGNLIVEAFSERTLPAVNGKPPEKTRWSMGFLPAISFEVAGK